jgi:hypothetical protein
LVGALKDNQHWMSFSNDRRRTKRFYGIF